MPEYAPMLHVSYYAQNYAGIIRQGLAVIAESHGNWEVVNEWVWFEWQICRGWLQGQLGQVLSVKIQGNWKYGMFKGPIDLKWPLEN